MLKASGDLDALAWAHLAEHLPVGVVVYRLEDPDDDESLSLVVASSLASELTGVDLPSKIGRAAREVPPATGDRWRRFARVARSGEPDDLGEIRLRGRMMLWVRAVPLPNHHVGLLLENTTERQKDKQQLRSLGNFLHAVIEHLPAMVFVKDAEELRFVQLNRAAEDILGVSRSAMLGKSDFDVFPKEQAASFQAADRETLALGEVNDIAEEPIQTPTGQRWLHTRKIPIPGDAGPTHLLGVSFDITDRKHARDAVRVAEANFRTVVELCPDIIFVTHANRLVYANPALATLLGRSEEDLIADDTCKAFVHPEDWERVSSLLARVCTEAITERKLVFRCLGPNGEARVLEGGVAPSEFNAAASALVVAHDVTDRDRREKELKKLHAELEERIVERTSALTKTEEQLRHSQRLEAVGRLVGGIAHDFNNMLSVILSYSNLLLADAASDDPSREDLVEIQTAAERAARLARQLLAFGRQQILAPRELDLNAVINEMSRLLERVIGEDVQLEKSCVSDLGAIWADPTQIEQVLMNLVVNARDAIPRRGVVTIETTNVTLSAEEAAAHGTSPGRFVTLSVSDSGVGMDRETQARIFEPFFTTKEAGKGSGLGLSTVFGIVRQSGGRIFVYSEPGEGTNFKIYLPRYESASETEQPPRAPTAAPPPGTETILVVEDDEQVRLLVRTVLRRNGYKIIEACTPDEAIAAIEEHGEQIALLLSDVIMPKMSGPELSKLVRERLPNLRILLMSGYSKGMAEQKSASEISDFLGKPITPQALAKKVREVLDR